jgi:hypothetical protein
MGAGRAIGVTLTDRRQITFHWRDATIPAISSNGKRSRIARDLWPAGCTYGIELQDVMRGGTRGRSVGGASAIYSMEWSPDSRTFSSAPPSTRCSGRFSFPYAQWRSAARSARTPPQSSRVVTSLLSNRRRDDTKDAVVVVSGLDGWFATAFASRIPAKH